MGIFKKCAGCGTIFRTVTCLETKKPICRSCCETLFRDCGHQFECWGRIE